VIEIIELNFLTIRCGGFLIRPTDRNH